nr:MAG TPA: hypothetical protein [Caudoviricetes sp.]
MQEKRELFLLFAKKNNKKNYSFTYTLIIYKNF